MNDVQLWSIDGVIGLLSGDSVPTSALQNESVTAPKLGPGAVTTPKIANGAVTAEKLNDSVFSGLTQETPNVSDFIPFADTSDENKKKKGLLNAILALATPTGAILEFGSDVAPSGFLNCDGKAVSRDTFSTLFGVIGTRYGAGDGSTTFNVPDRRWNFARGYGPNIAAACSGSAASNNVTATANGFNRSGVRVRVTGTPVTGLSLNTDYFTIWVDENTLAFATSRSNALIGTKITISGAAGSMTVIQYEDPDVATREAMTYGGGSGAQVGSIQDDAFQNHTLHTSSSDNASAQHTTGFFNGTGNHGPKTLTNPLTFVAQGGAGTPRVASETRPKNISSNFIIRT